MHQRILRTIGVKNFIKYYYDFKNDRNFTFEENFSANSENTIRSMGRRIFRENIQKEILSYIINEVKNVDKSLIDKAKYIYSKEFAL